MFAKTLSSTALKVADYRKINRDALQEIRSRLGLSAQVKIISEDSLSLPLSEVHALEANVIVSPEGIPHGSLRIKALFAGEGGHYPTWKIEQRPQGGQGNVLFVIYRRPNHWMTKKLTLDEELRPSWVDVNVGDLRLLEHIAQVVPQATRVGL